MRKFDMSRFNNGAGVWHIGPFNSITCNRDRIGFRSKWLGFVWYLRRGATRP